MHKANIGPTRCGKTYQAIAEARKAGKPVLFINPKAEDIEGMIRLDGYSDSSTLTRLLSKGLMVNYVPHEDLRVAMKELDIVVRRAMELGNLSIILDEATVHGYQGLAYSPLINIAERGAGLGVIGHFLCQDPGGLSKRILRNCEEFRIFAFNEYSRQYFAKLGYDVDKMQQMLLTAGKYSYIIIERGEIKGIGRE